jgi:hypothetical protein
MYYALTGLAPNITDHWEKFNESLFSNLNYDTNKDYYFIVINKNNGSDIILQSLKGLKKSNTRFLNNMEAKLMRGDTTDLGTSVGTKGFISKRLAGSGYLCYEQGNPTPANAGYLAFYNGTTVNTSTAKFTVNTWNHVAYVYDGTNLSIYKDGSRVFGPTAVSITNSATTLKIGYDQVDANAYFTGYMDEVRITKGIARYSGSSFTVPALAHPTQ